MSESDVKDEDQIEIILDPIEEEKQDDVVVEKAEETPRSTTKVELSPEEGISELQAKLEQERQARIEAQRQAREAQEQANQAQSKVDSTELHMIKNAIDQVKHNNELLKANYRDALATGDYDQAAELQEQMIVNQSKLSTLENGRKAKEEAPRIAPVAPQHVDLIDNLASQVTPESAQWLRQNRDQLNNPKKLDRAMRAHADALDDGIVADTPEYFRFIENRLGINRAPTEEYGDPMAEAAKPIARRSAPPAAPVTRSGTGTGTTRPNVVRLTSSEREMASMMQMTDQEYARHKVALQREGKIS